MLELVEDLAQIKGLVAITVKKEKQDKKIIKIHLKLYSQQLIEQNLLETIFKRHSSNGVFHSGTPFIFTNYLVSEKSIDIDDEVVYDPVAYIYSFKAKQ